MTFTDGVIVVIVLMVVGLLIYRMIRKKDESFCASCSYNKGCIEKDLKKKLPK